MKNSTKRVIAIASLLALGLTAVKAQSDGALLDALVKKGVLSDQEAEDIRASEAKDFSTTAAGKFALSDHVTALKLYGDGRLRYDYIDENPQNRSFNNIDNNASGNQRYRYRIRVGADYTFTDNFKAGFELESSTAADSANQSIGNGFGKYSINVGLIYLQWKPIDFLTLTGGKQRNPLYTTDLMWDPDINPEGASEVASWTLPIDFGSSAPASRDPKDMKSIVSSPEPSTMSLTIGLTAAQFVYADNGESGGDSIAANTNGSPNVDNTDVWIFAEQVPIQFNFDKNTFVKEVPGIMTYTGGGNGNISGSVGGAGSNGVFGGGTSITYVSNRAADDLNLITAPGEFDFKLADIPMRAYWDFSYNIDGGKRIQQVYLQNDGNGSPNVFANQNAGLGDNIAWLAGLQVGQNKKKGDWSIKADYRQVGLGAVDPNINDSDWGDSFLNQQGVKIQSVYNFTDFLTGSLTYYNTWNYKSNLFDNAITGAPGGAQPAGTFAASAAAYSLAAANATQRVQVDLLWKF